jgi:hypothetical protein
MLPLFIYQFKNFYNGISGSLGREAMQLSCTETKPSGCRHRTNGLAAPRVSARLIHGDFGRPGGEKATPRAKEGNRR